MYTNKGRRYISDNSERYPRQQSPLLMYLNHLGGVPDNELCKILQKNIDKSLQLLRNDLSPDEIINTTYLLLRVSKLDVDFKTKTNIISVILPEFSLQLDSLIMYIPFIRNSEYGENLSRFWFAILDLIQELVKLNDPLHTEYIVNIYLNCKMCISYQKFKTLNLPEMPESIMNNLKKCSDIDDVESINFILSQSEIEKFNTEEAIELKSLKEFETFKEYFKWQYLQIRREFICILNKSIKNLYEAINSGSDNNEFQIILNCTAKLIRSATLIVDVGECKQEYFENEEFMPGSLACFSYNKFRTYTFGILNTRISEWNTLLIEFINIDPCLLSRSFSMAVYKKDAHIVSESNSILKSIKQNLLKDLPFKEYIFLGKNDNIRPPQYLLETSEYDIDGFKFKPCDLNSWPPKEQFQLNTEQYITFQHLVTKEIALLTGYPGSGKTRVVLKFIELLLKNTDVWHQENSGPILILTFTNKSLDNFLEKILPLTDSLFRNGTRKLSEIVKEYSLEEEISRASWSNNQINNISAEMCEVAKEAQDILKNSGLIDMEYLGISQISNQNIYDKLMGDNKSERTTLMNELYEEKDNQLTDVISVYSHIYYVTVRNLQIKHDKNSGYLEWRLMHKEAHKKFYPQNGFDYNNLKNLSGNELWALYFYLVDQHLNKLTEKINVLKHQKYLLKNNLRGQKYIQHSEKLKQKMIVGSTFSGAAIRKSLIDALNSPIVIVEEASLVEHYYILGIIPKSCKHLIMIADGRAGSRISETSKDYSLVNVLLDNNYPVQTLKKQFRMKYEIALLLKKLFYPDMISDDSIETIPSIPGIPKPVFFINHCIEDDITENFIWKRAINVHEIEYLTQLVKFLLSRDVSAESITILTTTKYQALEFDKIKENEEELQKVQSWPIEKFQSLENDIILLSLVGINEHNKSFLTKEERLRVAFSRCKRGFYLIGNMEKLCKEYDVWFTIRELLEANGYIGNALPISCPSHDGKECAFVEKPEDFMDLENLFVACNQKNF